MKTRFYIVRHGESLGNMAKMFLGHTDLDLSELGYIQAQKTADKLRDVHFDYIYSSDLKRAYNTAVPNAEIRGMRIITSEELREIHVGKWEGKTVDEILLHDEDLFINGWRKNFGTATPPEGESVIAGGKRFMAEIIRIAERHPGCVILVTTHAAVLRSFWGMACGMQAKQISEELHFAGNASYSIVDYVDGKLYPIEYSICEHLGGIATFVDESVKR